MVKIITFEFYKIKYILLSVHSIITFMYTIVINYASVNLINDNLFSFGIIYPIFLCFTSFSQCGVAPAVML